MKKLIIINLILFMCWGCEKDPIPYANPTITTGAVTDLSSSTVEVAIVCQNISKSSTVGVWLSSTSAQPGNSDDYYAPFDINKNNITDGVCNYISLSGLTSNTKYYYRAYITNGKDIIYGDIKTFTTPSCVIKNGYTLTKSEIWSGNILLKGDIVVPSGITLTINPGTIINISTGTPIYDGGFQTGKTDFYILGNLIINGNVQNIVQLKSVAITPTSNDWGGIFMNGNQLNASYCYISDSYYGVFYFSSAMKIQNCLFNNMSQAIVDVGSLQPTLSYNSFVNVDYGYWLFETNRNGKLDYSEFKNNFYDVAVDYSKNSSISINYSNFSGNKSYNLYWNSKSVTNFNITANYCFGITTYLTNGNGNTYTYTNRRSTSNSGAGCGFSSMAKSPSFRSSVIANSEQGKRVLQERNEDIKRQYEKMKR